MTINSGNGIRGRSRLPMGAGAGPNAGAADAALRGDSGWMKSGGDARQAAEREIQRQKEIAERRASGIFMPHRFWVGVGESREVIVLDSAPGACFYEHNFQGASGK